MDILLLGNGFDLHHKLPTTYLSFLKVTDYLCSKHIISDPMTIGMIFKEASKDYKFLKTCYEEYKSVYDSFIVDFESITDITKKCQENVWWNYFKSINNKELGWIDFEKEISKVIEAFRLVFLSEKMRFPFSFNPRRSEYEYIVSHFSFIFDKLPNGSKIKNKYLISYPYDPDSKYINSQIIISDLFNSLKDFAEILKQYFIVFVDKSLEKLKEQDLIQKNMIEQHNWKHVISFNYTKTYEKLYSPANVHHIHGVLDKNIILGVNSDEWDTAGANNPFISFKKYYQRVVQQTDVSYYNLIQEIRAKDKKTAVNSLIVIGHSLDSTDKDLITEIFSECDKITICYHNQTALNDYYANLINIYGKTDFDKLRIEKNITFFELDS